MLGDGATPHAGSPEVVSDVSGYAPASPGTEEHQPSIFGTGGALSAARAMSQALVGPLVATAAGVAKAAASALGLAAPTAVDEWGKDLDLTRSLHPLADFLYERYWRVSVENAERVPAGGCLIIANHSGALPLDGPVLSLALRRERPELHEARWLVEDQVFHAPGLGVLMNRLGAIRAHPDNAVRLLDEGRPVIVFPEGVLGLSKPFQERYQLKRFGRGGFIKLAVRQGVPVVPAAIVGAEEAMPLLGKLPGSRLGLPYLPLTPPPLPTRWTIRFGDPIDLSDAPEDVGADLAWVQRASDRTRDVIAAMLQSMLRDRHSTF